MVARDGIRAVGEQSFETLREVRAAARSIPGDELASRVAIGFAARQLYAAGLVTELGAQRVADGSRKLGSRIVTVRSGGRAADPGPYGGPTAARGGAARVTLASAPAGRALGRR
jgi:hypothetical protein